MAALPNVPIIAPKRVPYDDVIPKMGVDYTGYTPLMHVRLEPGQTGTPLITLGASTAGSQGIAISYDADYPDPFGELSDGATIVQIIIDEATLEALALNTPASTPLVLYYDIHLTPSAGKKFIYCEGTFTIPPGVTV